MSTLYRIRFGLLAAMAFVLMYAVEFPLPFFPEYLKYDPSEVPVLLGAFTMGPWAGFWIEVVKDLLFLLSGKSTAGIIGVGANFVAGAALVVTAGLLFRRGPWAGRLLPALAGGAVAMAVVMAPANYFVFLPLWGVPRQAAAPLIFSAVIPFNLAKGVLTGLITLILYPRLVSYLGTDALQEKGQKARPRPLGQGQKDPGGGRI